MEIARHGSRLDRDQYVGLTPREQKAHFEEHGFLWVPDAVNRQEIERLVTDLDAHQPRPSLDYASEWPPPSSVALITNHNLLAAIRTCIGDDIRFFKGVFGQWLNHGEEAMRRGRQTLHRDFDNAGRSSPTWCNSAVYCLDLEPDRGPFWVIPGTHRLPLTANGTDFEHLAGQALMLCARAGDAALFHCLAVHAGGVMPGREPRSSFFYSYRPGNVPAADYMPEWPPELLESADDELRPLLER